MTEQTPTPEAVEALARVITAVWPSDVDEAGSDYDQLQPWDQDVMKAIAQGVIVSDWLTERVRAAVDEATSMHYAYRPEVVAEVAVHLGSHDDWDEIVRWTGGRIETSQDPSGEYTSSLVLPSGESGGDWAWLVLNHAGEFHFRAEVQAPDARARIGADVQGGEDRG